MKYINNFLIKIITLTILINYVSCVNAQEKIIKLDEAIAIAQKKSFEYKIAFNQYQSSFWNFKNYKTIFLPALMLDGTIPSYSRSITRITLPSGEDTFVNQNQSFSSLNLGLKQNISYTGGILSVNSNLNRIDVFGNNRLTNFFIVPFSLSYVQNSIGFNQFKWLKQIEPLRFELSEKKMSADVQEIGRQTADLYFNVIATEKQQLLSKQNLITSDTLNRIAKKRFKIGTVTQSELLQLQLNQLNAENKLREDSIDYFLAKQKLSKYLLIDIGKFELVLPQNVSFYEINFEEALEMAKKNSQLIIDSKLKRLEAEKNLAQTKSQNNIKFNIQANFGVSNSARKFSNLYDQLSNQQNISLGFSLPLMDWGYGNTQKLRAQSNLALVNCDIEQQQMQVAQEITLYVLRWNSHQKNILSTSEATRLAERNYELELERYKKGNISINDLNIAQNQKDFTQNAFIAAIRTYWDLYYTIRKLTLYDFEKKIKILK